MTKLASSRMLVGVPLLLALVITLVAVAWLQSAAPLYASHGTIRVAGIGGNFGTRAADTICAEGDVDCVITRINSASVFNAMTPTQLRDSYDVLLITWGTSRLFDLDWDSRLQPYMTLGGGVIWEDPNNLDDISAIITTGGGSSWPPDITATVPGLTDGVVGGSASSFANNHLVFSAWDPGLSPFMTGSGGNGVLGLWGHVGTGGCIVLQGPDADFHANRTGSYFVEQYELLANEIIFVSHTCTPSTPPNRPPTANANGPYYVNEGGSAVLSGAGHDPDGDPLTYSWDLDNNGSFETAGQNPTFSAAGLDGPDDRTATLQVCDPSNACDTDSATITIVNVAPVASVTNDGISEAGTASLTITFSDVGAPDTHTVVVDWDEGMVDFPGVVASPFDIDHVYGDDGTYDVTVTVTDDDGGVTTGTGMVAVGNLDPTLTLNIDGSIGFASGTAFLGRKGVEQMHSVASTDPGSDDLTFDWAFNPDATTASNPHYNNGVGPEPISPSPHGAFPFTASDSASVTFSSPGIYVVSIDVSDDDEGSNADSLDKLVTDDCDCAEFQSFWKQQFKERTPKDDKKIEEGKLLPEESLQIYLGIVNYGSGVFTESMPLTTLADANNIFNPEKSKGGTGSGNGSKTRDADNPSATSSKKKKKGDTKADSNSGSGTGTNIAKKRQDALQHTLAAWLNFARGALDWDEDIVIQGGTGTGTNAKPAVTKPFSEIIAEVEAILNDPDATAEDYQHARKLAESANKLDKNNPDCDTGTGSKSSSGTGTATQDTKTTKKSRRFRRIR